MSVVHVAAAVIRRIARDGNPEILLARRPDHLHQGGLWEFPGGKVESGEDIVTALNRELYEELGIARCLTLHPLIKIAHDYGDKRVLLDVWRVDAFSGEPFGREGQQIQWVKQEHLTDYAFPAANVPIVTACRLPRYYSITPEYSDLSAAMRDLASRRPAPWLLLRQPKLRPDVLAEWYRALVDLPALRLQTVLLSGDPAEYPNLNCAGFHLPFHVATRYHGRPVPKNVWLGVSCHTPEEIAHAQALAADFITLSPVLPTPSHPGRQALGWANFESMTAQANMPVYALGGVDDSHFEQAIHSGGQGIAGIRWW